MVTRKVISKKRAHARHCLPLKKGYHRHHIEPLHAGGKVHPWNEIYVRPHLHADLHLLRWIETGDTWDYVAYMCLMGWSNGSSVLCEAAGKKGGTQAAINRKQRGDVIGWKTKEEASKAGQKGGKIGGKVALQQLLNRNPNHQSEAGKIGGAAQAKLRKSCDICGFVCRPTNMWRHLKAKHGEIT